MIYALVAAGFLLWYGLGRMAHAYAEALAMACFYEWENNFAVIAWPFFGFCILAERLADRARRAQLKREHADAMLRKALKELESEGP